MIPKIAKKKAGEKKKNIESNNLFLYLNFNFLTLKIVVWLFSVASGLNIDYCRENVYSVAMCWFDEVKIFKRNLFIFLKKEWLEVKKKLNIMFVCSFFFPLVGEVSLCERKWQGCKPFIFYQ